VGWNDLRTTHPQIAIEADGWDPTTVTAGSSGTKKKWKCSSGHTWKTSVAQRSDGHGCPSCSTSGFDPNKNGFFYLLVHESWGLNQIGITNDPDSRISSHRRLGWELIELRGPMDGHLTRDWETFCLRYMRKIGVHLGPKEIAGKFDGYSESWRISEFEVPSIAELMNAVRDDESKTN
jgi:hypothetical protein